MKDRMLSCFLITYFALHFFELQTAFDTSISYPMLILMVVTAVILVHRMTSQDSVKKYEYQAHYSVKYIIAVIFLGFFGWSFFAGWLPFVRAQLINGTVRSVGDSVQRLPMYRVLLNSPVDRHAFLWRTSTDFERGISQNPAVLKNPQTFENLKKEIAVFENLYREFVAKNPDHFRAKLNFADILIYERLFGVNKLDEAQQVLDQAIAQVPQSPQPYWMKAVGYIYMKKFDLAREYAQKGLALNPQIKQSQDIVAYVEKSIKTFPQIDLYFFRQI
jgi:tetratricopeptide (TPR) repeat protein